MSRLLEPSRVLPLVAGLCVAASVGAQELDLPDVSLVDAATVAEMPDPMVGEVREFVGPVATIPCSRWEIVTADAEEIVSACEHYRIHFKRSEQLNMYKVVAAKGEIALQFEPAYPAIQFPLKVGAHWREKYTGHSAIEGLSWDGDVECDVADFAEVKVAAGAFKAFRIECRDRWRVGENGSSVTSTTWYAPDIAAVVKTLNYEDPRWNTELAAYSR
ncbi:MAG: hypothetical protein AB7O21_10780 [Gammaproteobacteria bacterium]